MDHLRNIRNTSSKRNGVNTVLLSERVHSSKVTIYWFFISIDVSYLEGLGFNFQSEDQLLETKLLVIFFRHYRQIYRRQVITPSCHILSNPSSHSMVWNPSSLYKMSEIVRYRFSFISHQTDPKCKPYKENSTVVYNVKLTPRCGGFAEQKRVTRPVKIFSSFMENRKFLIFSQVFQRTISYTSSIQHSPSRPVSPHLSFADWNAMHFPPPLMLHVLNISSSWISWP